MERRGLLWEGKTVRGGKYSGSTDKDAGSLEWAFIIEQCAFAARSCQWMDFKTFLLTRC
jgi:hypothetical protein